MRLGFNLYLIFIASWFLHLPARIPVLGLLRVDLLLVVAMTVIAFMQPKTEPAGPPAATDKILRILIAFVILTIPFVEYPGSVVKVGLPNLIKAIVFYYFTIAFIRNEADLRKFIAVFIGCQMFRIVEPLYLHLTQGYWGNAASMENGLEFLDRLSGAPVDVVNANGLAYVICTALPFLYFLSDLGWRHRLAFVLLTPACLYALALTGSRSGLVGLAIVGFGVWVKSKRKLMLIVSIVAIAIVSFSLMSSDMQDRYLSTVGLGVKNKDTAAERFEGAEEQFHVFMRRPFFGYGLGTSAEANYHFSREGPYEGRAIPAHNLYLEVAQELGIFGVFVIVAFLISIAKSFLQSQRVLSKLKNKSLFQTRLNDSMQVWLAMSFVFSFASYGLSSYDWYLFGGMSVILLRMARKSSENTEQPAIVPPRRGRGRIPTQRRPARFGRPVT